VAFVFVGVDERIDRPVLSEYLGAADAVAVRGWIASASNLKTLTLRMGVHMNEVDGVLLAHAPFVYLLDEHGRLRVYVPKAAPVDELIAEVRRLLP
jgi:cytochrome oxidase Cu insertion factor (SCO1/SenC/PrrC family)